MDSPHINKSWNKYETALLIDAYQQVANGAVRRIDAVRQLSKRLREGMKAMGVSISDTFRNENGISMQMTAIKGLLSEEESTFGNPSAVFVTMCDMFFNNREGFSKILGIAERMFPLKYSDITTSVDSNLFPTSVKESEYDYAESPFRNTLDKGLTEEVFRRKFHNGMRLGSPIDRKKFRNTYSEISGRSIDDVSDEELISSIGEQTIRYEKTSYMPELMLPEATKRKLVGYIQDQFLNGDSSVFFEVLFSKFHEDFLNSQILNVEMLRDYLQHINNYGWYIHKNFISIQSKVKIDIEQTVLDYIAEQGSIVTEEEILDAFPQFPKDKVLHAFQFNSSVLINCGRGLGKIHIHNFHITDSEYNRIVSVIDRVINKTGFMLWAELVEDMKNITPDVLGYNERFNEIGIRNAMSVLLGGKFYFRNNVICRDDKVLDTRDILKSFARNNQQYTLTDVDGLASSLNTNLNSYIGDVLEYSVRLNEDDFISKSKIRFNSENIDQTIDGFIKGDYMPIQDVDKFSLFPNCGYQWSEYLLESYVNSYSKLFRLMHNSFLKNNVTGVIVRKGACYKSYDDVMADFVANSIISLSKDNVMNLLYENGLIAKRRMNNIGDVIQKARIIRKKGKE